jgi:hypothetical protein
MAKKRKTKKRITRRTLSAAPRKRTMRRRKKGMSELFNASTAMAAGRTLGAAAIGGVIASGLGKMLATQPVYSRIGAGLVASFVTYTIGGFPSMAAGMAGAIAAQESQPILTKLGLADGYYDYANADSLNEMPIYLNDNGDAVYLNEDGSVTLAEDIYLANNSIYPNYNTNY